MKTADICDQFPDARVCVAGWRSFGGLTSASGRVVTVRSFEDAGLIRQTLSMDGRGCVLVVDGGGSLRKAILGDRLAALGAQNGWAGALVYGAVRDVEALGSMEFAVFALGSVPARGCLDGSGECEVPLSLEGFAISPGMFIAMDADGVVTTQTPVA